MGMLSVRAPHGVARPSYACLPAMHASPRNMYTTHRASSPLGNLMCALVSAPGPAPVSSDFAMFMQVQARECLFVSLSSASGQEAAPSSTLDNF